MDEFPLLTLEFAQHLMQPQLGACRTFLAGGQQGRAVRLQRGLPRGLLFQRDLFAGDGRTNRPRVAGMTPVREPLAPDGKRTRIGCRGWFLQRRGAKKTIDALKASIAEASCDVTIDLSVLRRLVAPR